MKIRDCNIHVYNEKAGKIKTKLKRDKLIIDLWDVLKYYEQEDVDMGRPLELELGIDD